MQTKYSIASPEEMIELGKQLVASGYTKFGLRGELGAGKTHFTKWVAQWLGLDVDLVHSPTYVYFHEYEDKLIHVDMYRITDVMHITKIWLSEKLEEYKYWCVERPQAERVEQGVPVDMVFVDIAVVDAYHRDITISTPI